MSAVRLAGSRRNVLKIMRCGVLALLMVASLVFSGAAPARACGSCQCQIDATQQVIQTLLQTNLVLRQFITDRFKSFQLWLVNDFFFDSILPSMRTMSTQLTTVGMLQVGTLGTMLDAKQQLEIERLYADLAAQAHRDYEPSQEMCALGTISIGLGQAERNAKVAAVAMSKMALDRQLGSVNTSAAEGLAQNRRDRVAQFKRLYCNPRDMNGGFSAMCPGTGGNVYGGGNPNRWNEDINFSLTVGLLKSLDLSFASGPSGGATGPTADEENVIALSNYLFAHDVFERIGSAVMATDINEDEVMEARSIAAKRSVAYNSFASIVGLEISGGQRTGDYARAVMQQLKATRFQSGAILGSNPSQMSLLEVLSQKIYQDPHFYMNLYDKPANLARREVAMQAIGLMVDRTAFESELRTESLLSVLLEMELLKNQEAVSNRLNQLSTGGRLN